MHSAIVEPVTQRVNNKAQLILILGFVVTVLTFVGYQLFRASGTRTYPPGATFSERARLTEFITNGVRVAVFMESDSQELPLLRATFTPTEQGFHLYSKDLNPKMSGGIGMATRFELLPNPAVRAVGSPFSDVAAQSHNLKELKAAVDIYPDGPVTLRLPIHFLGTTTTLTAQVAVTYMACKTDGICLPPVERRILDIRVERSDMTLR